MPHQHKRLTHPATATALFVEQPVHSRLSPITTIKKEQLPRRLTASIGEMFEGAAVSSGGEDPLVFAVMNQQIFERVIQALTQIAPIDDECTSALSLHSIKGRCALCKKAAQNLYLGLLVTEMWRSVTGITDRQLNEVLSKIHAMRPTPKSPRVKDECASVSRITQEKYNVLCVLSRPLVDAVEAHLARFLGERHTLGDIQLCSPCTRNTLNKVSHHNDSGRGIVDSIVSLDKSATCCFSCGADCRKSTPPRLEHMTVKRQRILATMSKCDASVVTEALNAKQLNICGSCALQLFLSSE